jgi:predicted HTH domain antitoxin
MSLVIPDEILSSTRMTEAELLQELAVTLFQQEKLTLGQASKLAQTSQAEFMHILASRKISLHYDVEELHEDVRTLQRLGRW